MKSKATPEHGKGVVRGKSKGRKSKGNLTSKKKKKKETKQGLLEDKGDIATEEKNKTKQNTSAF